MIEYLLILTLTVAVVLAVSKGVGAPMQDYIQKNVLDMVGCMLRVGQFPTKSFGLCQNAIQVKMDASAASGGSANGSDGSGSSSSSSNDENSTGDEDGAGNSDGSSGDSENEDSSNRTRVRSNNGTNSLNDSGDDSAFGNGPTTRVKISNDDSAGGDNEISTDGYGNQFGETTVIVRRIKRDGDGRVGGSFLVTSDEEAGDDSSGPETYSAVTSQENIRSEYDREPSGKRFSIPKPTDRNDSTISKSEDVDFSFLGMIKWIIILGVLFFIIVFAASQLNSIRKGWTD